MASWVRSAFSRTAEAATSSGRSLEASIQRAGALAESLGSVLVRAGASTADAVERGAKMVLEQAESAVVNARYNDFRHAVRRMEEAAMAFADAETESEAEEAEDGIGKRKAAMRRWLAALKELEARGRVDGPEAAASVVGDATSDAMSAAPDPAVEAKKLEPHGSTGHAEMPSDFKKPEVGEAAATGLSEGDESSAGTVTENSGSAEDDKDDGEAGRRSVTGQEAKGNSGTDGMQATAELSAQRSRDKLGLAAADADVVFYDGDPSCTEPLSFRDVFLESLALEHIVASLVAEQGDAEEWILLRQLFHLCLVGSKDECNQLASAIEKLAQAFASYSDTKLSGDALLDMVTDTITALKLHPQLQRLRDKSSQAVALLAESSGPAPAAEAAATAESGPPAHSEAAPAAPGGAKKEGEGAEAEEARAAEAEGASGVQGSRLHGVPGGRQDRSQVLSAGALWLALQRQQHALLQKGDTPGDRLLKIEKVSSAARELQESAATMSSGIADCRKQREEALTYQSKRAMENKSAEKVALGALSALEAKRDELQRQLDEVSASIGVVQRQLQKLAEEKWGFYTAGAQTVDAFESEGALRAHQAGVLQADARALRAWQGFLESSWPLERRCLEAHQQRLREECTAAMPWMLPIAKAQLSQCQQKLRECNDRLQRQVSSLEQTTAIRNAFEREKQKGGGGGAAADAEAGAGEREGEGAAASREGGGERDSGRGAAEEVAVARKQAEQEEDYLMCEFKSKAAAGEAMQAASEIQRWIDWASLHSPAVKDRQEMAEVRALIESIKDQVKELQGTPRPLLTRDDPSLRPLGALGALGRYPESKSWRLDSIGSVLHSGIVVAPVMHAQQGHTATKGAHSVTKGPPALDTSGDGTVVQGDVANSEGSELPDQLPTPTVISGKRRNFWG